MRIFHLNEDCEGVSARSWREYWMRGELVRVSTSLDSGKLAELNEPDVLIMFLNNLEGSFPVELEKARCIKCLYPGPVDVLKAGGWIGDADGLFDAILCDLLPDEWPVRFPEGLRSLLARKFRWLQLGVGSHYEVARNTGKGVLIVYDSGESVSSLGVNCGGQSDLRLGELEVPRLRTLLAEVEGVEFLDLAEISFEVRLDAVEEFADGRHLIVGALRSPSESSLLESLAYRLGREYSNWVATGSSMRWVGGRCGVPLSDDPPLKLRDALKVLFEPRSTLYEEDWFHQGTELALPGLFDNKRTSWDNLISAGVRSGESAKQESPQLKFLNRFHGSLYELRTLAELAALKGFSEAKEVASKLFTRLAFRYLERHRDMHWSLAFGVLQGMFEKWTDFCGEVAAGRLPSRCSRVDFRARIGRGIAHGVCQYLSHDWRVEWLEKAEKYYLADQRAGLLSPEARGDLNWLLFSQGKIDEGESFMRERGSREHRQAAWSILQTILPFREVVLRESSISSPIPGKVWELLEKDVSENGQSIATGRIKMLAKLYSDQDDEVLSSLTGNGRYENFGGVALYSWLWSKPLLAREIVSQLGKLSPYDPNSLFDGACAHAIFGDLEEAFRLFKCLSDIDPGFMSTRGFLGTRAFFYASALKAISQSNHGDCYRSLSQWIEPSAGLREMLWNSVDARCVVSDIPILRSWAG